MAYGFRVIASLFRRSLDTKCRGYFSLIAFFILYSQSICSKVIIFKSRCRFYPVKLRKCLKLRIIGYNFESCHVKYQERGDPKLAKYLKSFCMRNDDKAVSKLRSLKCPPCMINRCRETQEILR